MRDLTELKELLNPEGIVDGRILAAQTTFYEYCKLMNPKFYRDDRPYQRDLCDTLQGIFEGRLINPKTGEAYRNLMINLPPRHGKSYTLTLFVQWCMGRRNETRVISVSYNDILAGRFARNVRDGIDADKLDSKVPIFHDVFPSTRVKQGDAAAQLWSLEGQFFNYLAQASAAPSPASAAPWALLTTPSRTTRRPSTTGCWMSSGAGTRTPSSPVSRRAGCRSLS